jgi:Cofactor assembly of complex C subunit B
MKANNYDVVEAGETIKFRGVVQRSFSQAAFLVFCTALAFLSLGLVLQIQFQDLGRYDEAIGIKHRVRSSCSNVFYMNSLLTPFCLWNCLLLPPLRTASYWAA